MKKISNQLAFVPILIYFYLTRKKTQRKYIAFKQMGYKKWYPWQWEMLDKVMKEERGI